MMELVYHPGNPHELIIYAPIIGESLFVIEFVVL